MRIGELAARAGTTTRTLRYYESRGLLAARRTENGYRTAGWPARRHSTNGRVHGGHQSAVNSTRPGRSRPC